MYVQNLISGLQVAGIGLAGVFVVLLLFYFSTKAMMRVYGKKPEK